jgi:hypothetical protein
MDLTSQAGGNLLQSLEHLVEANHQRQETERQGYVPNYIDPTRSFPGSKENGYQKYCEDGHISGSSHHKEFEHKAIVLIGLTF